VERHSGAVTRSTELLVLRGHVHGARFHFKLGNACPPVCHASAGSSGLVWTSVTVFLFIEQAVLVARFEEEGLDGAFSMEWIQMEGLNATGEAEPTGKICQDYLSRKYGKSLTIARLSRLRDGPDHAHAILP